MSELTAEKFIRGLEAALTPLMGDPEAVEAFRRQCKKTFLPAITALVEQEQRRVANVTVQGMRQSTRRVLKEREYQVQQRIETAMLAAAENAKGFYAAKSNNKYVHPSEFAQQYLKSKQ